MPESANYSVHSAPSDPPLTDVRGKTWRLTGDKHVLTNGIIDRDLAPVVQLAYVNEVVWRQTTDLRWASKRHPDEDWLPRGGSHHSPLGGQASKEFEEIETAVAEVQEEVQDLKHTPPEWLAGVIEAQAQAAIRLGLGLMEVMQQNQDATVLLLKAILAKLDAVGPPKPTAIVLDIAHGTYTPQPRPSRTGP